MEFNPEAFKVLKMLMYETILIARKHTHIIRGNTLQNLYNALQMRCEQLYPERYSPQTRKVLKRADIVSTTAAEHLADTYRFLSELHNELNMGL